MTVPSLFHRGFQVLSSAQAILKAKPGAALALCCFVHLFVPYLVDAASPRITFSFALFIILVLSFDLKKWFVWGNKSLTNAFVFTLIFCLWFVFILVHRWTSLYPQWFALLETYTDVVSALPENVTISFDRGQSILIPYNESNATYTGNLNEVSIDIPLSFLNLFKLELLQPGRHYGPAILPRYLYTLGGLMELLIRARNIPTPYSMLFSAKEDTLPHLSYPAVDITEYFVGDRVYWFDAAGHKSGSEGTIVQVFPSVQLDNFRYEVSWQSLHNGSLRISNESARNLIPMKSKISLFPGVYGSSVTPPRSSLAIITATNLTILQGFSHYYGRHWTSQKIGSYLAHESDLVDKHEVKHICRAESEASPRWSPISVPQLARYRPVLALAYVACQSRSDDSEIWDCSKSIARENHRYFIEHYSYLFPSFEVSNGRPWIDLRLLPWQIVFGSVQTLLLFTHALIFTLFFVAPSCYALMNALKHFEDESFQVKQVWKLSLMVYSVLLVGVAASILMSDVIEAPTGGFTSYIETLCNIIFTCVAMGLWRMKTDVNLDSERTSMLQSRKRKLRIVGRVTEEEQEPAPFCRICFDTGGEFVTPCLCDGTIRHVHPPCLAEWRARSSQSESFIRCDQCGFRYMISKTLLSRIVCSSLVLSILSFAGVVLVLFVAAVGLKLVDVVVRYFGGPQLSDIAVGPKIAYFVKTGRWLENNPVSNPTERLFVESATRILGKVYLELGHVTSAFTLLGFFTFLFSRLDLAANVNIPCLVVGLDHLSGDEGWLLYLGGKNALLALAGQYQLFCIMWDRVKVSRLVQCFNSQTSFISVSRGYDDIKSGTVLQTPYGRVEVVKYRKEDDILETVAKDHPERDFCRYKLYRNGRECLLYDKKVL